MQITQPSVSTIKQTTTKTRLVKLGIIGLNDRAKLLTRAAANSDKLKIVAAHGASEQERRAFQLETRVPVVSDLKTLLSYPMLDGVIVNLPAQQHLSMATEIAKAKKHIFLEAPIAVRLEEGLEIAALQQKYGITIAVGHATRFLAGIRKMRETIDAGELGTVKLIEANISTAAALGATSANSTSSLDAEFSDALAQVAVRQFDAVRYLGDEIREVSAMAARSMPSQATFADVCAVLLRFEADKLGYLGFSANSSELFSVRVIGSKASMHYEVDENPWDTPGKLRDKSTLYIQRVTQAQTIPLPEVNASRAELEHFAEACRSGNATELSAANANAALAAFTAAIRSIRNDSKSFAVADILRRAQSRM